MRRGGPETVDAVVVIHRSGSGGSALRALGRRKGSPSRDRTTIGSRAHPARIAHPRVDGDAVTRAPSKCASTPRTRGATRCDPGDMPRTRRKSPYPLRPSCMARQDGASPASARTTGLAPLPRVIESLAQWENGRRLDRSGRRPAAAMERVEACATRRRHARTRRGRAARPVTRSNTRRTRRGPSRLPSRRDGGPVHRRSPPARA
jgi:hypothetical protein